MSPSDALAALVTGGSGGLGRAICVALAERGARVAVSGRDTAALEETAEQVRRAGGRAITVAGDVRREMDVVRIFATARAAHGPPDVVVAAAGVSGSGRVPRPVAQLSLSDWTTTLDTNLRGVLLVDREAFAAMVGRGGDIVNIVSARAGTIGHPYAAAYSASKHAVAGLSAELARSGTEHGIRVQALFPDAVDTSLLTHSRVAGPRLPPDSVGQLVADLVALPRRLQVELPVLASVAGPHPTTRRLLVLR